MTGTLLVLMTGLMLSGHLSDEEILGQADARIEQCRKGDITLRLIGPAGEPIPTGRQVRIEQTGHAFLFGCNIFKLGRCKTPEDNAAYERQFAELLNYATLPFYWWSYEKEQGKPDYANTDRIIRWCREHKVTTKGHPLAWNYVDPKWLPGDPAAVMELQLKRIGECVRRFADGISFWDVVNEATQYDRQEVLKQAPKLSEAIRRIGVGEYVRSAFAAARKANPNATLIINDYRVDEDYARKVIDELVDKADKPLYDVIGIQSHQHGGAWPVRKVWDVCERYARYGKPLHFTETTFLSGELGWELPRSRPGFKWVSTPNGEKRQAEEVARFYTVLFSHPAVEAITWWDFTDQGSWQEAPSGLLRADMTPKPAYDALKALIKGKWWTRTEVSASDKGEARLRGFFGEYRVVVTDGGRELTGSFWFDKSTRSPVEVRLK